jgi:hypothetical protein
VIQIKPNLFIIKNAALTRDNSFSKQKIMRQTNPFILSGLQSRVADLWLPPALR